MIQYSKLLVHYYGKKPHIFKHNGLWYCKGFTTAVGCGSSPRLAWWAHVLKVYDNIPGSMTWWHRKGKIYIGQYYNGWRVREIPGSIAQMVRAENS